MHSPNQVKIQSISKNSDFESIRKKGSKFFSKTVLLISNKSTSKDQPNQLKVAYTASKKVGGAVVRNKIKRRMREAFRSLSNEAVVGFDYNFIALKGGTCCDYKKILGDVRYILKQSKRNKS